MEESHFIIPRKYPEFAVSTDLNKAKIEKHAIAILLALGFMHEPFQALLNQPTNVALGQIGHMVDPTLLAAHRFNFPNRYHIPPDVGTYLLALVYDKASQAALQARRERRPFNMAAPGAIIIRLLMAGANPLPILAPHNITAADLDGYLKYSPPTASRDYQGYTLAHAHCLDDDFVDKKLPILLKYKVDINSTPQILSIGTFTHVMLANEHFDQVLALVRLPAIQKAFDPKKCDGERKTIPIIAAKVRAEAVLLALADLYQNKLAINAQDGQGCTIMHYCFGLGLVDAVHRYADLGANLKIPDNKGRLATDYLNLSPEETGNILRSIEIHPGRDVGAAHNAILGRKYGARPVLINNLPVLAAKENFTAQLGSAAYEQFGEEGMRLVAEQYSRIRGISLLQDIMSKRAQLKFEHEKGLIIPAKGGTGSNGPAAPSSDLG